MSPYSFDVGTDDFAAQVIAASHRVPVVVDFWAAWCAPCRTLKPILEKLAEEFGGRFLLAKVDSDAHQELAVQFRVRGIPAVKVFVNGEQVDEFSGALPEAQVREFLQPWVPSLAEPFRLAAAEAAKQGDPTAAVALLQDALRADPGHEPSRFDLVERLFDQGQRDDAAQMLASFDHRTRDETRLAALQARLTLTTGQAVDMASLAARVQEQPEDLPARHDYAQALAAAGDYRAAMTQFLDLVKRDRRWQDEAGRKGLLNLFTLLAADERFDDLVREFRIALARTLN